MELYFLFPKCLHGVVINYENGQFVPFLIKTSTLPGYTNF
jgi:hypothetical protein